MWVEAWLEGGRGVEAGRCGYVVHRLSAPGDEARAVGLHREVVVVEGNPEHNIDIHVPLHARFDKCVCEILSTCFCCPLLSCANEKKKNPKISW